MLEEPAKFEFDHRLLGRALHGKQWGSNNDGIMIGFVANVGRWLWVQTQRAR